MSLIIQNIIVMMLVAGCLIYIAGSVWKTLSRRKGGLGSCCAKGCDAGAAKQVSDGGGRAGVTHQADVSAVTPTVRTIFIPSEMLKRSPDRRKSVS